MINQVKNFTFTVYSMQQNVNIRAKTSSSLFLEKSHCNTQTHVEEFFCKIHHPSHLGFTALDSTNTLIAVFFWSDHKLFANVSEVENFLMASMIAWICIHGALFPQNATRPTKSVDLKATVKRNMVNTLTFK